MTDRELQLVDLCARLPYKTYYDASSWTDDKPRIVVQVCPYDFEELKLTELAGYVRIEYCKPYLRPMSSMTEEEREEYLHINLCDVIDCESWNEVDWLNAHHFDYRGLIKKGLALEAPNGIYK